MSELNSKGKIKLKARGAIERFKAHSDNEKTFAKEHGTKAYEALALKRSIAKKMESKSYTTTRCGHCGKFGHHHSEHGKTKSKVWPTNDGFKPQL